MTSVCIFVPNDDNTSNPGALLRLGTYTQAEATFEGSAGVYLPNSFVSGVQSGNAISSSTGSSDFGAVRLNGEGNIILSAAEEMFVGAESKIGIDSKNALKIQTDDGSANSINLATDNTLTIEANEMSVNASKLETSKDRSETVVDNYVSVKVANSVSNSKATSETLIRAFNLSMSLAGTNMVFFAVFRYRYFTIRYNFTHTNTAIFFSVWFHSITMTTRKLLKLEFNWGSKIEKGPATISDADVSIRKIAAEYVNVMLEFERTALAADMANVRITKRQASLKTSWNLYQ